MRTTLSRPPWGRGSRPTSPRGAPLSRSPRPRARATPPPPGRYSLTAEARDDAQAAYDLPLVADLHIIETLFEVACARVRSRKLSLAHTAAYFTRLHGVVAEQVKAKRTVTYGLSFAVEAGLEHTYSGRDSGSDTDSDDGSSAASSDEDDSRSSDERSSSKKRHKKRKRESGGIRAVAKKSKGTSGSGNSPKKKQLCYDWVRGACKKPCPEGRRHFYEGGEKESKHVKRMLAKKKTGDKKRGKK